MFECTITTIVATSLLVVYSYCAGKRLKQGSQVSQPSPCLCATIKPQKKKNVQRWLNPPSLADMAQFAVGSRVRAPLPNHARATRRAVIAILQQQQQQLSSSQQQRMGGSASSTADTEADDDTTAVVIFEDDCGDVSPNNQPFFVTPKNLETEENEIEATLPLKNLAELLEFETIEEDSAATPSPLKWKERGDALMRLHDHAAAAFYYEKALRGTSRIQIGGTVLVKTDSGHVVAAEIDCIDGDDMDVSFLETGEEATVPKRKSLLAAAEPEGGSGDHLQERILLNLARCMLQLAETTGVSSRRPQYLRAAVLGCTFVLALCSCHSSAQDGKDNASAASSSNLQLSALLLRGQAQAGLQKFPHAQADFKRLLALDPQHKEGRRQMQLLERQKAKVVKTNKRLAKDVSQWVQSVMHDKEQQEGEAPSVSDANEEKRQDVSLSRKRKHANDIPFWLSLITVVLLAWFVQKHVG